MYICELYLIMKRIRLDIGAVTATPENGGSFMFFLYKEFKAVLLKKRVLYDTIKNI